MGKIWLIENDEDTDNKFAKFTQIEEILKFFVCHFEKITNKTINH